MTAVFSSMYLKTVTDGRKASTDHFKEVDARVSNEIIKFVKSVSVYTCTSSVKKNM